METAIWTQGWGVGGAKRLGKGRIRIFCIHELAHQNLWLVKHPSYDIWCALFLVYFDRTKQSEKSECKLVFVSIRFHHFSFCSQSVTVDIALRLFYASLSINARRSRFCFNLVYFNHRSLYVLPKFVFPSIWIVRSPFYSISFLIYRIYSNKCPVSYNLFLGNQRLRKVIYRAS